MEEGFKIALMTAFFWFGVAFAKWRHPELFRDEDR